MVHWTWGLSTAVLIAVVIWLNGRQVRAGWLLGALVQLVNVTFGWWIYDQWTFLFLLIPAGLFLWNWWQHPKREAARRRAAAPMLVDVDGSDQVIVMRRDMLGLFPQGPPPPLFGGYRPWTPPDDSKQGPG